MIYIKKQKVLSKKQILLKPNQNLKICKKEDRRIWLKKLVGKMVDADDKLNMLKKSFPNYADNNYMVCNNNNL